MNCIEETFIISPKKSETENEK